MNNKLFLFALFGLIPVTSMADYRMHINFSDPSSISFGSNTSEPGEGTPEEPTDPVDTCPTNFPAPTFLTGFPYVQRSGLDVIYNVQITAAGGYASYEELSTYNEANSGGKRYFKMLTTRADDGILSNLDGGLYVGTTQSWMVKNGNYLKVTVTPIAFDMKEGTVCATGTPFILVNKTHTQLYSEAP